MEAPILRMRFGGLPTWLVSLGLGLNSQGQPVGPEVQIGGELREGRSYACGVPNALPESAAVAGSSESKKEDRARRSLEVTAGVFDLGSWQGLGIPSFGLFMLS